jgi:hypothetical protein
MMVAIPVNSTVVIFFFGKWLLVPRYSVHILCPHHTQLFRLSAAADLLR